MPRGTALLSVVALLLLAPGCAKPAPKIDAPQPAPPQLPPDQVDASAAIEGVRVFDGERVLEDMTVLLSPDGTILELGPSQKIGIPEGVELIEGFGHTLLPGLIDAHTHVWMAEHLRMALAFGVTTELDMFTQPGLVASFKDAEAKGAADDRADLRSSGILATAPGGHGTEFGFEIPTLTRADEAAAFVDARIAEGSDYLKIVYDDGAAYGISFESLTPPVVAALVAQSHARDKLAVVHIGAEQGAVDALRAGADGLAHVFMDREPSAALLEQVRARPVFITDTLAVAHAMCDPSFGAALAADPELHDLLAPADLRSLSRGFPVPGERPTCTHADAAVKALRDAGATILASTDAPNPGTLHGASLHGELELLVGAGLTPIEALQAATSAPARVFKLDDRGRIARGLRADLLLVEGDPTRDIKATRRVVAVWKRGQRVDREAYMVRAREQWELIRRAKQRPPPPGSESGLLSDFESGDLTGSFGSGWQASTDSQRGGGSTVSLKVVKRGAKSRHALEIAGVIDAAALPIAWAGAVFLVSLTPMHPENLSAFTKLSFRAKGDVDEITVMLFAAQLGRLPAQTTVKISKQWDLYTLDIAAAFDGLELYDLQAVYLGGAARAGAFRVQIDDVKFE